jgi:uncharacterized membrane protein
MIRSNSVVKTLIFLAVIASLLSFAKFNHCRNSNWAAPDSYVHACYSDIPILFSARSLASHQWAFKGGDNAVEYPVIMGAVMWATSWLAPGGSHSLRDYFDFNAILIALLFIFSVFVVWKIRPEYAYLSALSPGVIAALYINWDLWGIVTMLLAIYYFDRRKQGLSASLLAISIATKIFPVFLILPIVFILWRRDNVRAVLKYLLTTSLVWLAINAPVMLTTPKGWWHFYKLNLDRGSDWGSLRYSLSLLGLHIKLLNYLTATSLLLVLVAMVLFLLEIKSTPTLAEVSFILLAATLCIGKVYSPQYVLWLVPLAVIAIRERSQLFAFWLWQAGEMIYHLAIWQHLASVSGSHFGLPEFGYALASLTRIATSIYLITVLMRHLLKSPSPQAQISQGRLPDFLLGQPQVILSLPRHQGGEH